MLLMHENSIDIFFSIPCPGLLNMKTENLFMEWSKFKYFEE